MIIKYSLVGSSKGNGVVEGAIQSVQGMIRTKRSAIEEHLEVRVNVTHSVWPWIAEQAGFLPTRSEIARDGRIAYERPQGKSANVHGLSLAEGTLYKRRRAAGPLGWMTCMWRDGVFIGIKAITGEVIVGS